MAQTNKLLRDNCMFGVAFAVDRDAIKQSKTDIIDREKTKRAIDMGLMLSKKKGWEAEPDGNLAYFRQELYVFTHAEMTELVDRLRCGLPLWDEAELTAPTASPQQPKPLEERKDGDASS